MSARSSRSASIPIPPNSSASAARSLEEAILFPLPRPVYAGAAPPRTRRTSTVSRSPDDRRGPSISPVRSTLSTSPSTRPMVGSYSSAVSVFPRGPHRPGPGGPPSSPTNTYAASLPTFQPRIIRAASSPNPSSDSTACLPIPPQGLSASPTRPRRLSASLRPTTTPAVSYLSASLPAGSYVPPLPHAHSHPGPHITANATHHDGQVHGFPRPEYLEYSALRDFLYTDSPAILPPSKHATPVIHSHPRVHAAVSVPYPYLRRSLTPVLDSDSEGTPSPSPPPTTRLTAASAGGVTPALSSNPVLRLPTRWSEQDRNALLSVSMDGRELTFCGPSCGGERDSAAARANHPIPRACGIYYYEVEILQKGKGHISIGFSAENVRLNRLPGWEALSWGFHADDGFIYSGQKEGSPYSQPCDAGDVIGCGIDFSQNRAFYTKNGTFLGMVFDNLPSSSISLYPSIGLRHINEAIRANFGSSPFRYAIEDHVRAQRDSVWAGIMRTGSQRSDFKEKSTGENDIEGGMDDADLGKPDRTKEDEGTRATLQKLVMSYLAHHGYAGTARAFRAQCVKNGSLPSPASVKREVFEVPMETDDAPQAASSSSGSKSTWGSTAGSRSTDGDADPTNPETPDFQNRVAILHAVRAGDIDKALDDMREYYPRALDAQDGLLLFHLRCRKFVELVLKAGEALRRVKEAEKTSAEIEGDEPGSEAGDKGGEADADGEGAMDVDDPSPEALSASTEQENSPSGLLTVSSNATQSLADLAKSALHTALAYGQELEAEYKTDTRPAVRSHLRRTFGLVAYDDPEHVGGEVGAMAGQEARLELVGEVNQAILKSQDRPVHPALETLFRQTGACIVQLGLLGVGAAAFADVRQEFIES